MVKLQHTGVGMALIVWQLDLQLPIATDVSSNLGNVYINDYVISLFPPSIKLTLWHQTRPKKPNY